MKNCGPLARCCLSLLPCFFALLLVARPALAICGSHADCPVGQVCDSEACVPAAVAAPAQAGRMPAPVAPAPASQPVPAAAEMQPAPNVYPPMAPNPWAPRPLAPAPGPPAAIEPAQQSFGNAGQVLFWGSSGATLSSASSGYTNSSASTRSSNVNLAPNVGFFLSETLVLEAAVTLWRQSDSNLTYYGFGIESGLGFNVPVGARVSLLPEFRVGGGWAQYDYPVSSTNADHDYYHYWGSIGMPILFHLAPHFFIGGGPQLTFYDSKQNTPGANTYETVRITLQGMIGGWL